MRDLLTELMIDEACIPTEVTFWVLANNYSDYVKSCSYNVKI